jgi:competence protein ComEA
MKLRTLLIATTLAFSLNPVALFAKAVNINKADTATIAESLKGIGEKKAQAIVDFRKENGKFKKVDDLLKVNGIGTKLLEKIRADIRLKDTKKSK